jgi:hypothetical protein
MLKNYLKKFFVLFLLLAFMFITSPVSASLERDMDLSFDGTIDYVSETSSDVAAVVVVTKGTGSGSISQEGTFTSESVKHSSSVLTKSGDRRKIESIIGVKLNGNHYVQRVQPDYGLTAELGQDIEVEIDTFKALIFDGYTIVDGGIYQRRVELTNEGITLREVLDIVGKGEGKDKIRFAPEEE